MREATQFVRCDGNELVSLDHIVSIRFTGSKKAQLKLSDGRTLQAAAPFKMMTVPAATSAARSVESVPLAQG